MSKIPVCSLLALALALVTASAQSTTPLTEGDLFKNPDPINSDPQDTKSLTLPGDKVPSAKEKAGSQTEITADSAEFNNKTHIAIFIGGVIVANPEFNCNCDRLTAYLKHDNKPAQAAGDKAKSVATPATPAEGAPAALKSKGGLEKATAEMTDGGKVVITQEKKEADGSISRSVGKADRAEYNAVTGEVTLIGWPEVTQGFNSSKAVEQSTKMIMTREGKMRTIGRSKVIIQDNSSDKPIGKP